MCQLGIKAAEMIDLFHHAETEQREFTEEEKEKVYGCPGGAAGLGSQCPAGS